jgi:hypothetical protein
VRYAETCCYLAFAATREEARVAGYVTYLTDWRTTSPQAAHLWPYLSRRPFQYRPHRLIGERIAYAPSPLADTNEDREVRSAKCEV